MHLRHGEDDMRLVIRGTAIGPARVPLQVFSIFTAVVDELEILAKIPLVSLCRVNERVELAQNFGFTRFASSVIDRGQLLKPQALTIAALQIHSRSHL